MITSFRKECITRAIDTARKKGLLVRKNSFKPGWNITIPNGNYYAKTDIDMIQYVNGY